MSTTRVKQRITITGRVLGAAREVEIVLAEPCAACRGTGAVGNPAWQPFYEELDRAEREARAAGRGLTAAEQDALINEYAPQYAGRDAPEDIDCAECEGGGTVATEAGQAIAGFLMPGVWARLERLERRLP